ncbi:MAG TPA: VOC family protein, partial [Rhodothermales bacterium]|nr:VOC family protein [Rhodothermales bacterium]
MKDTHPVLASTVLYVNDVAQIVAFYRQALGLEPRFYDEDVGFAELGDEGQIAVASHGAGEFMMPGAYPTSNDGRLASTELAFYTADVQRAYDRAVAAGARSLAAPRQMEWGQTVAYVEDPAGTIL